MQDDSTTEGSSTNSNDVIDVAVGEIPLPKAASHRRLKTKRQRKRMRQLWMEFFEPFIGDSDTEESLALGNCTAYFIVHVVSIIP